MAPDDARAWLLAGEVERRRGRLAEARELWSMGVRAARLPPALRAALIAALADPESAEAAFTLGCVLQAEGVLFHPGFARDEASAPQTALEYFRLALARAPDAFGVLEHAALVLELAGCHEFARSYRERQVALAPADATVRARYARSLARSYMFEASVHHTRVAAALAGEDGITGSRAERWAAHREAGLALVATGATVPANALLAHAALADAAASTGSTVT
jgi:tetratricopeptide (TPR) repeat protein